MNEIHVVLVGLGSLGVMLGRSISKRENLRIVGAVDTDPSLRDRGLAELCRSSGPEIRIKDTLGKALEGKRADVAVLATVSDAASAVPQMLELISFGIPVVTTCEEFTYPWETAPERASTVDMAAKQRRVAVLATGVNPGFLMDALPVALTAVCERVERVVVHRVQDAAFRRAAFQRKIGAGLTARMFEEKKETGALRHVGLVESMHMIASGLGWKLDRTQETLTPVIAGKRIVTPSITVEAGTASGLEQVGTGYAGGEERIRLVFRATVGEPEPGDTVEIHGDPQIRSRIEGGLNGDSATCAIVTNAIPAVLRAPPGLRTMLDIPRVSCSGP